MRGVSTWVNRASGGSRASRGGREVGKRSVHHGALNVVGKGEHAGRTIATTRLARGGRGLGLRRGPVLLLGHPGALIRQTLEQMLFDPEHMRQAFASSLSQEDFEAVLDAKFPHGIVPARLDPIFAFDDPAFFQGLRASTVANLGFDLEAYWTGGADPDPDAVLLAFVNRPTTTFQLLDVDVALDRRAAENIVAHRDGPDGYPGGGDDDPFDTVDELDTVPYVGRSALEKLRAYATAHP